MKKFVLALLTLLFLVGTTQAQNYTRQDVENIWHKRYVPSEQDVDSTFAALWFKSSDGNPALRDSFMYTNPNGYNIVSTDSVRATNGFLKNSGDTVGYTGVAFTSFATLSGNQPDINYWFTYSPYQNVYSVDSLTLMGKIYGSAFFSDTIDVTIYYNGTSGGGSNRSSATVVLGANQEWVNITVPFTGAVIEPGLPQYFLVVITPYFTTPNSAISIQSLRLKIN